MGYIGWVLEWFCIIDHDGNLFYKKRPVLAFGYKTVNIVDGGIIVAAKLNLYNGDQEKMLRRIKEIWIYKKNNQPSSRRNAGCVFRNPLGKSAGEIIENAGLKGYSVGKAKVSDKHANIIVVEKDCPSGDVLEVISHICKVVEEKFEIELQTEIDIW